jgi:hypothetical protein
MQRKQQVGECWVCVIFFACVCVGASDSTNASDDPKFLCSLCHVRRALSWGGPRGGGGKFGPLGYVQCSGQRLDFFFFVIFAILADFVIFSDFLN